MIRVHSIALAALVIGSVASSSVLAQSAAPGGAPKSRAAIAAQYNKKMPACKAQAKREHVSFSEQRAFMRRCLKS